MGEKQTSLEDVLEKYKSLFDRIKQLFNITNLKSFIPKLPFPILIFSLAYYIVIFSIYTILLHEVYYTQAFDAGIQDQGTWLISRFISPFITIRGIHYFGDSLRLLPILWAPFLWIWNSINILFILQAIFVAIGVVPLYLFAKKKLGSDWLALCVGLSFLLYPALQNMNLEQYHPEIFSLFFIILTAYFLFLDKPQYFYPCLILSLMGKDDVVFTAFFIGIYLLLIKKKKQQGFITLAIAIGWYIFNSRLVNPIFNNVGIFAPQPVTYSHWFQSFMSNLFNPIYYIQNIFNPESIVYVFGLLVPLLFIPLLGLEVIFLMVPSVAVNILSGVPYLRSINYHYNYVQTGLIFFAFIYGIRFLQDKLKDKIPSRIVLNSFIGISAIICALTSNACLSQFPLINHFAGIRDKAAMLDSDLVAYGNQGLALIPKDAKVSASWSLVPHLSHRKEIYMFPNPFKTVLWNQWFMEGKDEPTAEGHVDYIAISLGNHSQEEKYIVQYLVSSNRFGIIFHEDQILILKKSNAAKNINSGALYTLFNTDSTVKSQGQLSNIYFPFSKYYLRNIPGEDIPTNNPIILEISGYMFFPETDEYGFGLKSEAPCQMTIDNKPIGSLHNLSQGFHKYTIKYTNDNSPFGFQLIVNPAHNKPYIVPDQFLATKNDAAYFSQFIVQYNNSRKALNPGSQSLNLLLNADFEASFGGIPEDFWVESWESSQGKSSACITEQSEKHHGTRSVKIKSSLSADTRLVQEIKVKPNTYYRLSGWIKTSNIPEKDSGAHLEIEGTSLRSETIKGTRDWKYVEVEGKTGRKQIKLKVLCRLGDYGAPTTGTAYFDDIKLIEIKAKNNNSII